MVELNFDINIYEDTVKPSTIELIQKIIEEALEMHSLKGNYEVSLSFVDDEDIRDINLRFRNKDSKTDVLSFPLFSEDEIKEVIVTSERTLDFSENVMLGDIIISVPTALSQAKEYNHSIERELCFLSCHSILHLLGYDHDTKERTEAMEAMQRTIMDKVGVTREF